MASPTLDFAGFYGVATLGKALLCAGLGVVALIGAEAMHRRRLRRV